MRYRLNHIAAAVALMCCTSVAALAQDGYNPNAMRYDGSWSGGGYRYTQGNHIVVTGVVVRVNQETGRLAIRSDSQRRYNVDTYSAELVTPDTTSSTPGDDTISIPAGARVRVAGYRYGVGLIQADRVVVLDDDSAPAPEPEVVPAPVPIPAPAPAPPVDATPLPPAPATVDTMRLEGVIKSIDSDGGKICVVGDDDGQPYDVKTTDADIIVPLVNRAGLLSDLSAGMIVHVVGERVDGGVIVADRIRVMPDEGGTAAPAPQPAITDLSSYTGIIIDVTGAGDIERSPAPQIYGPDMSLLYPDRSHVPTPDEVQDESIVRYYRSQDAAIGGVGGSHPLVLLAQQVVGPAHDSVMLSATDADLFKALDQRLGYTRNWKVGFLIPADK